MKHKIFAMELCLRMPDDALASKLRRLVREHPERVGYQAKWDMYRSVRVLLQEHLPLARSGCWDFWDDDRKAQDDFNMWCNGLFTEEGARPGPSGSGDAAHGDPRFMTFTMAFLLNAEAASVDALAADCNFPENMLWRRTTFAHLLHKLGQLNFSSVKGDVIYVIPGVDGWGLTESDLKQEKFHYLRPIQ